ncbi:MAG: hypothetical protein EXX96DRAFT_294545 [Benjaminiella poitrasii]|nr:MAG: hypothetical protein EXX96DRAFT_294545 [Benjaminiella poitrasii]
MARARKESAFHLTLLVLVQWISLAVIILNATSLYLLRRTSQLPAIVSTHSSAADYMLIILGSVSFVGATIYLVLHLHLYFRLGHVDQPFSPPRSISATEVIMSVLLIALWTVATSIILTHSQATSPCRFINNILTHYHSDVCELFNTGLMLAFAAVGGWVLVLLATLFILIRSPIPPTTIFTIEAPPQRFSQPMFISHPDKAYYSANQEQPSRPYYLGHYHQSNKIKPISFSSNGFSQLQLKKEIDSISLESHRKRHISAAEPNTVEIEQQPSSIISGYIASTKNDDGKRRDDEIIESTMIKTMTQSNNAEHNYYGYQSQHVHPLSPPTASSSASFYTPSCNLISVSDSQSSFPSLSTLDSIYKGYQPIKFDLPVIRVGMLSQIDVSFLQRKD